MIMELNGRTDYAHHFTELKDGRCLANTPMGRSRKREKRGEDFIGGVGGEEGEELGLTTIDSSCTKTYCSIIFSLGFKNT